MVLPESTSPAIIPDLGEREALLVDGSIFWLSHSAEEIDQALTRMAQSVISNCEAKGADFAKQALLVVGILKGGTEIMTAMERKLTGRQFRVPVERDFIGLQRYGDKLAGVRLTKPIDPETADGRHILIIDEISLKGVTLAHAVNQVGHVAASVTTAVLFDQPETRVPSGIDPDVYGFEVPQGNELIGFGMDYNNQGRHLPDVYTKQN